MLLTGACADKAAAQRYYADITQGLVEEIHLLERLAQTRGFAAFFSHQTTPKRGTKPAWICGCSALTGPP